MAEFYIETSARDNGDHVVHTSTCSQLPAKDTIYYLGSISNCASAVKKAGERFKQVNGCPHCATTCHVAAA